MAKLFFTGIILMSVLGPIVGWLLYINRSQSLEARFRLVQHGMTEEAAEQILGPSQPDCSGVRFAMGTSIAEGPKLPEKRERFWHDSEGVVEIWFADNKAVFMRYWNRVPSREETNRALQRARVRWLLQSGHVGEALRVALGEGR